MTFDCSTRFWRRQSFKKLCRVTMFQNSRRPVPITDTENLQNHSYELVRIVLTQKRSSDEDTQNIPSCHLLKQTSQEATGVDLACQAPVQLPRTGCETHELTYTSHTVPTNKHLDRVLPPSSERGGRDRSWRDSRWRPRSRRMQFGEMQ